MTAAVKFWVNDDCSAMIYPAGTYNCIDWKNPHKDCPLGKAYEIFDYTADHGKDKELLTVSAGLDGKMILRFTETKRYVVRMDSLKEESVSPPDLRNKSNKYLKCEQDKDTLTFQFINYLGRSGLIFQGGSDVIEMPFEVVPDKMNYEDDYIRLTESIAERCSELLLHFAGATSNVFTAGESDSKTLLEKFIFLRQFCFSENLEGIFASIRRNPDRILVEDEEFRPIGYGRPSRKVYTNPFSYTKNWSRFSGNTGRMHYAPAEIAVTQKRNSLDTPANRFLKFALQKFNTICENLILALDDNKADKETECRNEAVLLHEMLDDILRDSFFDDIGSMNIIPEGNQVLQKREGYARVLSAYNMIDLALQLDWKGKDDVYKGESKNIALLYEYWLFFELFYIIKNMKGCEAVKTDDNPFMSEGQGNLTISLIEGQRSCQSFAIPASHVKINLYYNRTFSPKDFHSTRYEGSYSRPFRPDYTLAVFPDSYTGGRRNGEDEAVKDGAVSYIHFDAKYRITNLKSLIGRDDVDEEKELNEEKAEEVVNTYQRGDLLKMHTYNDAIRRTVGSYVLYPGESDKGDKQFHIYDEILPGVGAFALRPGIQEESEKGLAEFIHGLILQKAEPSSRLSRMGYYSDMVIQEPASFYAVNTHTETSPRNLSNDLCVIGYIRGGDNDYYEALKEAGLLEQGKKFIFYYHAIKKGAVYTHHRDIGKAGLFRFFTNNIRNKFIHLSPVCCRVISGGLIARSDLVKRLNEQGCPTTEKKHHADYYYTLDLEVISNTEEETDIRQTSLNNLNGNDSFAPGSPRVIHISDLKNISGKANEYK